MKKAQLIHTLSFPMLLLGIGLCSIPYIALLRAAIGVDAEMQLHFSTTLMFLIGGYMAAIGAMIYLSRNAQRAIAQNDNDKPMTAALKKPHYLGLAIFIPVPFISFILVYLFWRKDGMQSLSVDTEYRKSLNFQITIHLYWLMSLFLMPIAIGLFTFIMALALHLFGTLFMITQTEPGSETNYPANIKVI